MNNNIMVFVSLSSFLSFLIGYVLAGLILNKTINRLNTQIKQNRTEWIELTNRTNILINQQKEKTNEQTNGR